MNSEEQKKAELNKRMKIMLLCMAILFSGIFISKAIQKYLMNKYRINQSHLITVSTMKVRYTEWQPEIKIAGSSRAVQGVNVTTELAGMVKNIYFTPGSTVAANSVLVQLKADSDLAQLRSLQANAHLAAITYERDKKQFAIHAISQQTLDTDAANLNSIQAQVNQQEAIVAKKTIKAPFAGRLGISLVNLGQYVNPGDKIVSLQMLDPMYVDFFIPQQTLAQIKMGDTVTITSDGFPGKKLKGVITTIDPAIDPTTRNATVEATVQNSEFLLSPGMFVYVEVSTGKSTNYLTLPQTAISFNPYGTIVYVVKQKGKDAKGQPILTANQVFIKTGDSRGEQIAILEGLKEGDIVVTSGQLKLKNGSEIAINNSIAPPNNPTPTVLNEG